MDDEGIAVRRHLIEPAERERLLKKAQRTGRTKTVVMAEPHTTLMSTPGRTLVGLG
jgi:hypothetical protein